MLKTSAAAEEEEGLHGVFKRLRRNRHQLEKGCCEQLKCMRPQIDR
jgi:hypothetical protein